MMRKEEKKAQVTIFILIAIVIVVIGLLVYFFVINNNLKQGKISTTIVYIKDSINRDILRNIVVVMAQGGYSSPIDYVSTPNYAIAYWIRGNQTHIPSKEKIQEEINTLNSDMAKVNLSAVFQGTEFETGNLTSTTTIMQDKIIVSINWPILIKQGSTTQRLETFNYEYKIRAGKLYDAASYVAGISAQNQIPVEMPQDMNLTLYLYPYATVYEIIDTNHDYTIDNKYASIVFAKEK